MLIQIKKKIAKLATKGELTAEQDKMIKLQAFGSVCLIKLSDEIIKPATTTNFLAPSLGYIQDKITFNHGKTVNIYIVYEMHLWSYVESSDAMLENSLFSAVGLVKNTDIDKFKYFGHGTEFDMKGFFSFPTRGFGKNIIIFEADMSFLYMLITRKKIF